MSWVCPVLGKGPALTQAQLAISATGFQQIYCLLDPWSPTPTSCPQRPGQHQDSWEVACGQDCVQAQQLWRADPPAGKPALWMTTALGTERVQRLPRPEGGSSGRMGRGLPGSHPAGRLARGLSGTTTTSFVTAHENASAATSPLTPVHVAAEHGRSRPRVPRLPTVPRPQLCAWGPLGTHSAPRQLCSSSGRPERGLCVQPEHGGTRAPLRLCHPHLVLSLEAGTSPTGAKATPAARQSGTVAVTRGALPGSTGTGVAQVQLPACQAHPASAPTSGPQV